MSKKSIGSENFTKDMEREKTSSLLAPSAQIGQHLIKEAFKEAEEKQRKQVVKQVSDIMERLSLMRAVQKKTERRMQLCEDQLEALNAGEFQIVGIGFAGVPGQRLENGIRFNNKELNITWDETERW